MHCEAYHIQTDDIFVSQITFYLQREACSLKGPCNRVTKKGRSISKPNWVTSSDFKILGFQNMVQSHP